MIQCPECTELKAGPGFAVFELTTQYEEETITGFEGKLRVFSLFQTHILMECNFLIEVCHTGTEAKHVYKQFYTVLFRCLFKSVDLTCIIVPKNPIMF